MTIGGRTVIRASKDRTRLGRWAVGGGADHLKVWLVLAALVMAGCTGAGDRSAAAGDGSNETKVRIEGIVRDAATAEPLSGARLTLTTNTGFNGVYVTRTDGVFVFILESASSCRLAVDRMGYVQKVLNGECLGPGQVDVLMVESRPEPASQPSNPPPKNDPPPPESHRAPTAPPEPPRPPLRPVPHVIVGVPDTGINPYHEVFYRPGLTKHPCTYIPGYPCDVPALELTLGTGSYEKALARDMEKWRAIQPGDVFWIPRTVFVGVVCVQPYQEELGDICILDDSHSHGTGTTSSVLTENPDALIVFAESAANIEPIVQAGLPVDIFSVSWGNVAPFPTPPAVMCPNRQDAPIYVISGGNDGRPSVLDCWKGNPRVITVGGGYANGNSDHVTAGNMPDVVSYFCRPTAAGATTSEWRPSSCGTSFAAPTAAGGLSKVVLELRRASGYTGSVADGFVDPVLGVTIWDLRDAMNRTASYEPEAKFPNGPGTPRADAAPWLQWGWGFYDGWVSNATIDLLLHGMEPAAKPPEAVAYMETVYAVRQALYA